MKNLEQIRAKHADDAIKRHDKLSRSAVNKLPAMIIQNGLLATTAFCITDGGGDNRAHMHTALHETARHLAALGLIASNISHAKDMIDDLCNRSSHELQRATAEALAFIAYLKRFAPKD